MDCAFFGTPEFAARILQALHQRHHAVLAVTRPDKVSGRGRSLHAPPVKQFCLRAGIPVTQPESAGDPSLIEALRLHGARVGVVVSYGAYLPGKLLASLPLGFINLHPSLLPRYRGAAPVNWAIIRGETETGLSVIRVTEKMDAGPILRQEPVPIRPGETAGELLERLAAPGAQLLAAALDDLEAGRAREEPQDESLATAAPRLRKEDGLVDWTAPSRRIVDLVRGANPWPGAQTYHGPTLVKILKAEASAGGGSPGTVLAADSRRGLIVAAGSGAVRLLLLQKEGGQPLPFDAFLRGARWTEGTVLTPTAAR